MSRTDFLKVEEFGAAVKWVGAIVASFWGGLPDLTRLLIYLMVIDIIFGLGVAAKNRRLSPQTAWEGITKKLGSIGMVLVAAVLSPYNPLPDISLVQAASAFYVVPELLSITRNAALLDVPVFSHFNVVLKYFEGMSSSGNKRAE